MKIIVTAKAKERSPIKDKNRKVLKRYWALLYQGDMPEKMTK